MPGTRPPPTVARAFELARSGECGSIDAIKRRLKEEQCMEVEAQLSGRSIHTQLRKLCEAAAKTKSER